MRLLVWALRALLFFTLFAFSLNNEQEAVVNGFFGTQWRAPMVIIVLAAFGAGAALGVLAMVPGWWRHRRTARRLSVAPQAPTPPTQASEAAAMATPSGFGADSPPRAGL